MIHTDPFLCVFSILLRLGDVKKAGRSCSLLPFSSVPYVKSCYGNIIELSFYTSSFISYSSSMIYRKNAVLSEIGILTWSVVSAISKNFSIIRNTSGYSFFTR